MRLPIATIMIILVISLLVDWYIFTIIKKRTKTNKCQRAYLFTSLALYVYIIVGVSIPRRSGSDDVFMSIMWMLYSYATILLPKIVFVIVDLIASIPQLLKRKRLKNVTISGVIIAGIIFITMWWGALVNRFNIDIVNQNVEIENLPKSFDGFRIVQISDLHVGSFGNDTTFLSNVVTEINNIKPDLIVFTGDIVNRRAEELKPYATTLSHLKAKQGVFSILGNHDYGDYVNWNSNEDKYKNLQKLKDLQTEMGWNLMLNESRMIYCGSDSIALIGVENWGDPPFTVYGDLKKSYTNLDDSVTKILLTHNPAHWVSEVADNDSCNIVLSLTGHTHAMQVAFGKLSPASLRYKTWGGKYLDKSQQHILYVNIGLGTVGIPSRIGANPEVTILTLRKK